MAIPTMLIPLLLFALFQAINCSCPGGFDLVRDGQCRGNYASATKSWDEISSSSVAKCNEIQGQPIIIRNDEEQQYWSSQQSSGQYIALGLVCNSKSKKWEWADGSAIDYKPPKGQYDRGCGRSPISVDIFCTTQLQQPIPSDNCESFEEDAEDGVCYQVGVTAQNWRDAQRVCRNFGADLATIHNLQENSFVRRLAVSRGQISGLFLGAMSGNEKDFAWNDGSAWDYNNFYPGFPIVGLGNCLAMDTQGTSGQWVNTDCSSMQSVACVRPQNYPVPACSSGPWNEGDIIYTPGFPFDASTPCDFILIVDEGKSVEVQILVLEANSCCDHLVLFDNYISGNVVANLTGEISNQSYKTSSSNFMRVSWQPNGGVNVRGMMVGLVYCQYSCPKGFDLVKDGECRGLYTTMNLYWDHRAVNTAIEKCQEIDGLPPIIHNEEHQRYYQARGWLVIALVCNPDTGKWMWTDRTKVDYRPPSYHKALDQTCKGGCSWDIQESGYWDFVCNSQQTYKTPIWCTYELPVLMPSADGCDTFQDDREDGICFQIGKTAQSWSEAQHVCRSFGGELASIHNAQENSFIRRLAVARGAVNGVYIGATTKNGVTKWSDNSRWDYSNFYSGFPVPGLGECVAMDTSGTSGQWVNNDCNAKMAVACERKQNYTSPTCTSGPWNEGDIITSPGFPFDASVPCDYIVSVPAGRRVVAEVLYLEANSCCDQLVITENYIGGNVLATLTGESNGTVVSTKTSNFMKISWQPRGGVNVKGMMFTFHAL